MSRIIDDNQKQSFDEALQQFVDSKLRGQEPDIEKLVTEYPEYEQQIRTRLYKLNKINNLFDSLIQTDESDFEDITDEYDLVGRTIGSFEIEKIIGQGGMGVVYLARDTKLKRSVAVKTIPAVLAEDSTARTRFRREAELLASLNHPNIAVIYEIIEEESGYLILEYVPGETLAERIALKSLELDEVLSIGQQIAGAISSAHKKGIVHRDLKPGNIKIMPDGRVKVLDFGLAKVPTREGKSGDITETKPGRVIGTPAYMSPEQARGKETDHRTDIWSFGCIMYQMLTSRLPFEGETATDTLAHIIERQPDWAFLPKETPENIRILLRHCLEKDPDRRLGDIADVVSEISKTMSIFANAPPKVKIAIDRKLMMIIGAVIIIVLSAIALHFLPEKQAQSSSKVIRLVILPFENLDSANDEDYSSAISAEIIGRLVGIRGLAVSSEEIAENRAMLLGKESGIDYVLKGTIQCVQLSDPNIQMMKIRPQLIRISDGQYVWAEPYDKDMSQIYQIPSELAEQVAHAMNITLLESEQQAIDSLPTENEEAYTYYLRGNDYLYRSYQERDFKIAIRMYEKAIELDPKFALAYSQLTRSHVWMFWFHYDRSKERLAMAKQTVDKALQLNPNLPEAHLASGHYYYHGYLDYDRALEQFAIARKSQPNNSELLSFIGFVQRRQGKFEQGLANIKRACELNPLSSLLTRAVGETFLLLRKYPEAEDYLTRAISLAPDAPLTYTIQARLYLSWKGSTEKARATLQKGIENVKPTKHIEFSYWMVKHDEYDRNYQQALDRLSIESEDIDIMFYFIPNALQHAQIYKHMQKSELAKKYYDEARSILEKKILERTEDARFHSSLGMVYAGLGRKEDAIREGKLAVELLPLSKEAYGGTYRIEDLARIYVMVGEFDAAIDQLEDLLSKPGDMSIPLLKLDPAWDPLRNHPRFKKLIETDN